MVTITRAFGLLGIATSLAFPQAPTGYATVDSANAAREAWRAATAAFRANDFATAVRAADRAANAWPTQEAYGWSRAIVAAAAGDTSRVLAALEAYADMGFGRGVRTNERLAPFLNGPRGTAVVAHLERNIAPIAQSKLWTEFADTTFWPEGVDIDARTGHAFVASIRNRTILEVDRSGRTIRSLPAAGTPALGAMFGVRVDAKRGVLWATTSGVPQMAGYVRADSTIAALLRIRLSDGVVEKRWTVPPAPLGHTLGDVVIAPNGDVFMTDSNDPVLYRLRANADTLERFTHPLFRSLQGMAPTPNGQAIYVADWTHGLMRVDLRTRAVVRLTDAPKSSSLGCDGIVLYKGAIIAVQNGAVPNRVMRFSLDGAGTGISRAEVIDRNTDIADAPTLGTLVGNEFVYVANSLWEKHDDNGARLPNTRVARPVLLAINLDIAQAQSPALPPAFATGGAFIGISVADLDASARWYADKLGMRIIMQSSAPDGTAVRVLEGGGLTVELIHNPNAVPLRTAAPAITNTTLVHGIFKAGVIVDDLDATLSTMRARGVDIAMGPFPARDGQRANAIIRDNSGNLIQLIAR